MGFYLFVYSKLATCILNTQLIWMFAIRFRSFAYSSVIFRSIRRVRFHSAYISIPVL